MPRRFQAPAALAAMLVTALVARAEIPLPDVTFFGLVRSSDGEPVVSGDLVATISRSNRSPLAVSGHFVETAGGTFYVVRVPTETEIGAPWTFRRRGARRRSPGDPRPRRRHPRARLAAGDPAAGRAAADRRVGGRGRTPALLSRRLQRRPALRPERRSVDPERPFFGRRRASLRRRLRCQRGCRSRYLRLCLRARQPLRRRAASRRAGRRLRPRSAARGDLLRRQPLPGALNRTGPFQRFFDLASSRRRPARSVSARHALIVS